MDTEAMMSEHVRSLEQLDESKIVLPTEDPDPQAAASAPMSTEQDEENDPETMPDPEFEQQLAASEGSDLIAELLAAKQQQQQQQAVGMPAGEAEEEGAEPKQQQEAMTGLRQPQQQEEDDDQEEEESEWTDSDDENAIELSGDLLADRAKLSALLDSVRMQDEDEDDDPGALEAPRTKNEIPLDKQPLPDLSGVVIPTDERLSKLGEVLSVVQTVAVIQGSPDAASGRPLGPGSILCLEDRRLVGAVHELFGPIAMPFYSVRFASPEAARALLSEGAAVHFVPSLAKFAEPITSPGTDASGLHDEELDQAEWFSDDEEEAEAKRRRKQEQRRKQDPSGAAADSKDQIPSGGGGGGGPAKGARRNQPKAGGAVRGGRGGGGGGGRGGHGGHQFQQPQAVFQQHAHQQQQQHAHQLQMQQMQFMQMQQQHGMMMGPGGAYMVQQQPMMMHAPNQPPMMMFPGQQQMYAPQQQQAYPGVPVAFGGFWPQQQQQQQPPRR